MSIWNNNSQNKILGTIIRGQFLLTPYTKTASCPLHSSVLTQKERGLKCILCKIIYQMILLYLPDREQLM